MALDRMGAASLLLLLLLQTRHTVSPAVLPEQPYPDVWLTGFEPIVIDGQPVEPACKIIPIGETTPAPPTAPPTTPPTAPPTTTPTPPTTTPAPPTTTVKSPTTTPALPTTPSTTTPKPPTIPPAPSTPPPPPPTAPALVPTRRAPPTPPPPPPTAPRLVPARRAPPPLPTAARSVPGGWPLPVVPFFPANGRAGVHRYGAGHRLVPPGLPLPGNRRLPARAPPRNLNIPAGGAFPNYALVPANPPPRRAHVPGPFLPAGRWASAPWGGLSRGTAAIRAHTSTSSDSSEEYRG